ncbi:MAG TPA: phosphoglucosamine mutase [Terriglobia bacterium]|nr:phosphoglucosamine mutase [Terriglobia bacterium]
MAEMSLKPHLFGTDGVRGVAGEYPLDRATVWKLGRALGEVLRGQAPDAGRRVVLGRDTRESGEWLAQVMAAGLASAGVDVSDAGVITTPGVAFLTRHHGFTAGVVVSASHNPYQDNGIKIFSPAGTKLPAAVELEIERVLAGLPAPAGRAARSAPLRPELERDYVTFLSELAVRRAGSRALRLVADCAHGAVSRVGPDLFLRLGIEALILNAAPDGRNINRDAGSLHPGAMARATEEAGADLGVAFDGDADRAIFATRTGRVADGDHVLYAAARFLQDRRELKGGAVAGTLMTNFALELALRECGLALERTPVGDRYVLEAMESAGLNLGGEPSGHIIFADVSPAGDGLITLLEVLRIMAETGESLDEILSGYAPLPQVIENVRVRTKPPLESIPEVADAIENCRRAVDGMGRVVVRYSGTEPLARVMVEAEDGATVRRHADAIAGAIHNSIGVREPAPEVVSALE